MGLAERGLAQADVRRLYHNWHLDSRRDSEGRVSMCWQSPANTARLLLCTNNWIFLFFCVILFPSLPHFSIKRLKQTGHADITPRLNPDYLYEWSHCVRQTQISQEIITLSGWTNNTELKTERTLSVPHMTVFIGWKNTRNLSFFYSPLCQVKPAWLSFYCGTQKNFPGHELQYTESKWWLELLSCKDEKGNAS